MSLELSCDLTLHGGAVIPVEIASLQLRVKVEEAFTHHKQPFLGRSGSALIDVNHPPIAVEDHHMVQGVLEDRCQLLAACRQFPSVALRGHPEAALGNNPAI